MAVISPIVKYLHTCKYMNNLLLILFYIYSDTFRPSLKNQRNVYFYKDNNKTVSFCKRCLLNKTCTRDLF